MKRIGFCLLALACPWSAIAANDVTSFSGLVMVPTFHALSVYVDYAGDANSNSTCSVQYRANSTGTWKQGLRLWNDVFRSKYTGSLVYLAANTSYQVAVIVTDADGVPATAAITNTVSTWSEQFFIGSVDGLSNIVSNITLTNSGSGLTNYLAYGPSDIQPRKTVNVTTNYDRAVTISADNVIFRNFDFIGGGYSNCVFISNNHTNIIIQNCTFANWGVPGKAHGPGTFPDTKLDSCILVGSTSGSSSGNSMIVIQNCTIGPGRGGANSWNEGHPVGPHAIFFSNSAGNNVVRFNNIHGSDQHYYDDAISGEDNKSTAAGQLNKDSDVYGNFISEVWDDAIEAEGRMENVRIWGNFMTNCYDGPSSSAATVGPLYDFRNVFILGLGVETNSAAKAYYEKAGWDAPNVEKARFTFHNTISDPGKPVNYIANSGGRLAYHFSSNNIAVVSGKAVVVGTNTSNAFDYDLLRTGSTYDVPAGSYGNVIFGTPIYTNATYGGELGGWFLDPLSPGYHAGKSIPNFSDDSAGASISNPNVGAFDERFPVLLFGPSFTYWLDPSWTGTQSGSQAAPWASLNWTILNQALAEGNVTVYFSAQSSGGGDQMYDTNGDANQDPIDLTLRTDISAHLLTLDGKSYLRASAVWSANTSTNMCLVKYVDSEDGTHLKHSNFTIHGFRIITNSARKCVTIAGDNFTVEDCDASGTAAQTSGPGFLILATADAAHTGSASWIPIATNMVIQRCTIHDNFGESIYVSAGGSTTNNVNVVPGTESWAACGYPSHDTILISSNVIYNSGLRGGQGDGIDVKGGVRNLTIQDNEIYNVGAGSGGATRAIVVQGQETNTTGQAMIIQRNLIHSITNIGDAAITVASSWGTAAGVVVRNNVIWALSRLGQTGFGSGVMIYTNQDQTLIANNTVVGCGNKSLWSYSTNVTTKWRNNLCIDNNGVSSQFHFAAGDDSDYNAFTLTSGFAGEGAHSFAITDAQAQTYTVAFSTGNFRALGGAPWNDVGETQSGFTDDLDHNTRATTWDIGAFEYQASGPIQRQTRLRRSPTRTSTR